MMFEDEEDLENKKNLKWVSLMNSDTSLFNENKRYKKIFKLNENKINLQESFDSTKSLIKLKIIATAAGHDYLQNFLKFKAYCNPLEYDRSLTGQKYLNYYNNVETPLLQEVIYYIESLAKSKKYKYTRNSNSEKYKHISFSGNVSYTLIDVSPYNASPAEYILDDVIIKPPYKLTPVTKNKIKEWFLLRTHFYFSNRK